MRLAMIAAVLVGGSCRTAPPLLPAPGTAGDDGHGELANASSRFLTAEEEKQDLFSSSARRDRTGDHGGAEYGGGAYGGTSYAGFIVPDWSTPPVNRTPKYNQATGLVGAIEGVVSWRGAIPGKRTTRCGAIDVMRVGSDRGVADVLVYIEKLQSGRPLPNEGRPASVGGLVVKRGCALVPTVQIVTPLPAPLAIHGDAKRSKVVVTSAVGAGKPVEIQEAGRVLLQIQPGVTRIDAEDGTLGAAWVVALDTPAYAVTDDRGRFRIDELAAGTYDVTIWHAPIPVESSGAIKYGAPNVIRRTIKVDATRPAKLDVVLGR